MYFANASAALRLGNDRVFVVWATLIDFRKALVETPLNPRPKAILREAHGRPTGEEDEEDEEEEKEEDDDDDDNDEKKKKIDSKSKQSFIFSKS